MLETKPMAGKPGELPEGVEDIDFGIKEEGPAQFPVMTAESVMGLIDTLRHQIISVLYAWIEEAKHPSDGRTLATGKEIPASFFQLLHCEQDANKLAFALENMRRHIVREKNDDSIRESDYRPDSL